MKRRKLLGVSLVEMMVALVILAVSATLVFEWIAQSSLRMSRLQEQQFRAASQLKGLAFLETLNPARAPEGSQMFDGFTLHWQVKPLQPMRPILLSTDAPSRFVGGLFEVQARWEWRSDASGEAKKTTDSTSMSLRLLGWREKPQVAFIPGQGTDQPILYGSSVETDPLNPRPQGVGLVVP